MANLETTMSSESFDMRPPFNVVDWLRILKTLLMLSSHIVKCEVQEGIKP
jgi:hypothetical protein